MRRSPPPRKLNILTVGVLALQGDVREHLAAFARCGVASHPVRLPDELSKIDALALPGGESTTVSRLLRVFDLEEPLRQRIDAGMPCFATCAGLIMLSKTIVDGRDDQLTLGAFDIAVRRNAYGRQVDSFEGDLEVSGVSGPPFRAVFIRAPQIESWADDVEVLASYDNKPVAIRQGRHLGLAFHPEMTGDWRIHQLFLEGLAEEPVKSAA
ncbi:MAG TPA: pyridoxal 5'-phosphate synthase glutaminase subunit PdxT [Candidatus Sulfotelmatobacter sp.]|nr:pyridoxal 5'-phosphate synthase glutaminase subunit PdxT [Candidatus Sulfotelmatobacter sp.]